ncbi:hypothetical protein [Actinoplanes sp. NPDC049681]|uniref:hypothetical protein n=1 Tax=Actinoplanes sp. NPDC049681 TaxID=3363905 RepID=UPI0037A8DE76
MDADQAVAEVSLGFGEFAPAHAGVGGGNHQDLITAAGDAIDDAVDLLGGGWGAFGAVAGGDCSCRSDPFR